jgi:hypothetical protein
MDEEKKTSDEKNPSVHTPAGYAAPISPEVAQNPQQNAPKVKQPLDSKCKKGLIIACVSIGVVLSLMITMFSIGFASANKTTTDAGTAYNGTIISGFFNQEGRKIAEGGSFTFAYQKSDTNPTFSLTNITVSSAEAKTIVLPYYSSSEESGNQRYYVLSTADAASGANLFANSDLKNVEAIYAERYYEKVGTSAFASLATLKSFAMGNTTTNGAKTTFGAYAFANDVALAKVSLPNSLTELGEGAFQNCSSLASLTLPGNLTTIGSKAFQGASALTQLHYLNTKEAFQKISLASDWKDASLASVVCTDGTLSLA